ncbi:MAG: RNA polymerase sigma factor RpoE [Gammaproteobacteria bacterium]|nr:RNA polymerase sigma factor RpoE [Gammaproteobacteria bacterium]MBI5614744.1 RNA polymerase sigma factor RpoE [Gammaproteobacteria bacterium]
MGDNPIDTDNELVARVQGGDKSAFDLLVLRYQHRIIKLVQRYVRDHDEAMDVAQESFIKAYRALGSFRGDSAFYTWLYRIAINTAKNYLVSAARRPVEVDLEGADGEEMDIDDLQKDIETPESVLLTDEIKDTVIRTIQSLPEDLRVAIMLREIEGLSYEEIAEAMDCPIGTVRSRIFRAREAIDSKLKPLLEQ